VKKGMDSNVNIGCGPDLWGDVRLDIRRTNATTMIADAQNLPFKQGTFKDAKMSHVLEHMHDPSKALNECLYVTRDKIMIAFPAEADMYPSLIRYLVSLPFSIRGILEWCKNRRIQEHKWIIKPEGVTYFLAKNGWETTFSKEKQTRLLSIFEGKRAPRRLKQFVKYLPYVGSQYIIIAKRLTVVNFPQR
jgi:ubiquinone/menaquinone biosynthesis C-methylase UbiE